MQPKELLPPQALTSLLKNYRHFFNFDILSRVATSNLSMRYMQCIAFCYYLLQIELTNIIICKLQCNMVNPSRNGCVNAPLTIFLHINCSFGEIGLLSRHSIELVLLSKSLFFFCFFD